MTIGGSFINKRNVFTLSITGLIITAGYQLWDPLLPVFLEEELRASVTLIGVIYTLSSIFYMTSAFIGGYLSDRIGKKKIIVICDFIATFLSFSLALTSTLVEFSSLLLLYSLFFGASSSVTRALIAESSSSGKRGMAFSNFLFLSLIGQIAGPAVGGSLAKRLGFTILFALSSLTFFIGTLLRFIFLRDVKISLSNDDFSEETTTQEDSSGSRGKEAHYFQNGLSRPLLVYMGCLAMFGFADDMVDTFISLYSKSVLSMSIEEVGFLFSARHLAMLLFVLPSGALTDKVGEKKCIVVSWILSPIVLLAFAFSKGGILSFVTYFLDGVAWAIRQPAMPSLLAKLSPPRKYGTTFGFSYLIRVGVGVPSPMLGGLMWETIGPLSLFYNYLLIMVLAALMVHLFIPQKK